MQNPAIVCNPCSHLEIIAKEFILVLEYVKRMEKVEDNVEKLKLLTAGLIGNYSYNLCRAKGKGPLNPFLGETYSAEMEDGTKIYLEFMSSNPIVTYVNIVGPHESFTLNGKLSFELKVKATMNSAKSIFKGNYKLKFKDGNLYEFSWPNMKIHSILSSPVIIFGEPTEIYDWSNLLRAQVDFPQKPKEGVFGMFKSKPKEKFIPN